MSKVAYVSGATGYIAQHIIQQLLDEDYKVIGSVRSKTKGETLKKIIGNDLFSYEIVPDIAAPHAFDDSLKSNPEVSVFFAYSFTCDFTSKEYEKDLLIPAIEGTKNALSAINDHGKNIKKVVITSSIASVGSFGKYFDPNLITNEKSFNPITYEDSLNDPSSAYNGSKTFAEKEVWKFIDNVKPKFEITTIHPVYVFGPQAFEVKDKNQLNFSAEIVNNVLKLQENESIPLLNGNFIDVRDVAKAHVISITNPETNGKRLILSERDCTNDLIANIINQNFPNIKIPKGDLKEVKKLIKEKGLKLILD